MIENIMIDKNAIEKEKKIYEMIIFVVLSLSCIYIFNIFSKIASDKSYLESTVFFIRNFSFILSLLAFGNCLISYYRVNKDKNIVLVSHSGIIRCLICYIKKIPLKDIKSIKLDYGEMITIDYDNEKYKICK